MFPLNTTVEFYGVLKRNQKPKFRCNTFAVLYCVLKFENATQCGRRVRKRDVATQLKSDNNFGHNLLNCLAHLIQDLLHWLELEQPKVK